MSFDQHEIEILSYINFSNGSYTVIVLFLYKEGFKSTSINS